MTNCLAMSEQQALEELLAAGFLPKADIEAGVAVLSECISKHTHSLYLARGEVVRIVGDPSTLQEGITTTLGSDPSDRGRVHRILQEIRMILQVGVVTTPGAVVNVLIEGPFSELDESQGAAPEKSALARALLTEKVQLILKTLPLPGAGERWRRLRSALGPIFDDLDVDLVTKRHSASKNLELNSPFLRLRIRYELGGDTEFPFSLPPWMTQDSRKMNSLEFDCDETDIDLMIERLQKAKDLLASTTKTA